VKKKKTESIKSFPLKLIGVYRAFAFVVIFAVMGMTNNAQEKIFTPFQIICLVFLGIGTILYFFLLFHPKILTILLAIEYFMVFYYPYVEPFVYMEFIWVPGSITAMAFLLLERKNVFVIALVGIAVPVLFSYGYIYSVTVSIGELAFPFVIPLLLFHVPITLLALLASRICFHMEEIKKQYASLESDNKTLNEINHAISQRIFNLQNDTTQKERNRLSKEIHDTAGYVFINLIMMLQAAQAVLHRDIQKADKLLGDARDYAERGINEIRYLLRNIRDYTPTRLSLQNELHDVGESFQKATDVEIDIEYGNWPQTLSKNLDLFFISFMQEALTNALKHGRATRVSVLCWANKNHIGMTISDNGSGVDAPVKKGIGITAMEDVASQMNGGINISGKNGFKISAVFPVSFSDSSGNTSS
jgi:signal transduction histidine kinase